MSELKLWERDKIARAEDKAKDEEVARNAVRPAQYCPEIRNRVLEMTAQGMYDYQISLALGFHRFIVRSWRTRFKDLAKAQNKIRKELALCTIEEGLHKRAQGFVQIEEKVEIQEDDDTKRTTTSKYFPPDVGAMKMLANKYADGEFVDKKEEKVEIEVKITQKDRALTLEERKEILERDKAEGTKAVDAEFKEVKNSK